MCLSAALLVGQSPQSSNGTWKPPSADGSQLSVEELMDATNTTFTSKRVYDRVK